MQQNLPYFTFHLKTKQPTKDKPEVNIGRSGWVQSFSASIAYRSDNVLQCCL